MVVVVITSWFLLHLLCYKAQGGDLRCEWKLWVESLLARKLVLSSAMNFSMHKPHFCIWLNHFSISEHFFSTMCQMLSHFNYIFLGEYICALRKYCLLSLQFRVLTCCSFALVLTGSETFQLCGREMSVSSNSHTAENTKASPLTESETWQIQGKRCQGTRHTDWSPGTEQKNCSNEPLAPNMETK